MAEQLNGDEKSHIRCKIIIEVLGKPQEHVEKSIHSYIDRIQQDSGFILLKSEFSEPIQKEEYWAMFVEIEIVIKGLHQLVAFCFDYMPSSVEFIKPEQFSLKAEAIQDFINNLQARLHQVDMVAKQLRNENQFMKKNLTTAVKNTIAIALSTGKKTMEQLRAVTGIHQEELQLFLDQLIEDSKIISTEGFYSLKTS